MRVLGIDPGTEITGYGAVERGKGGSLTHLLSGVIRLKTSLSLPARLLSIRDGLASVIEEVRPDAVAVESVFFGKNFRSSVLLGHARGVALLSAASCGVEVYEYDPKTIKLSVAGYGNAPKDQVQRMVKTLLKNRELLGPDASDALAAAICHISHSRALDPKDLKTSPRFLTIRSSGGR